MVAGKVSVIHSKEFGMEVYAVALDGHMLMQRGSRGTLV